MGVRFTRSAVTERGKRAEAMAFAAEISEYWKEHFGVPVTVGAQVGGTLGTIHWHADYENLDHFEKAIGFATTDPNYLKLIDGAQDLFTEPPEDTIIYTI